MKKTLLVFSAAALILSSAELTNAQTSQIDRMRAEQQSRAQEMRNYVERMQAQPTQNVFGEQISHDFGHEGAEPQYQSDSSSSDSGGFRIRRSRGLGKLIGLVVVGVFAVGGFILRLVTGNND